MPPPGSEFRGGGGMSIASLLTSRLKAGTDVAYGKVVKTRAKIKGRGSNDAAWLLNLP